MYKSQQEVSNVEFLAWKNNNCNLSVNSDSPMTLSIDDDLQKRSLKKLKEENKKLLSKMESMQNEYNNMLYQMSSIILSKNNSNALKESEQLHIRRMFGQNYCQIVENYFAIINNFNTKFETTRHNANIIVLCFLVAEDFEDSKRNV